MLQNFKIQIYALSAHSDELKHDTPPEESEYVLYYTDWKRALEHNIQAQCCFYLNNTLG